MLIQGEKYAAMRAAGTQHRRAGRQVGGIGNRLDIDGDRHGILALHPGLRRRQNRRRKLADAGDEIPPVAGDAVALICSSRMSSNSSNHHTLHAGGELADQGIGERERPAEFQHRGRRKYFADILVGHADGDDAE